jgi:O-succinylbenzoic acid--CoA ligase
VNGLPALEAWGERLAVETPSGALDYAELGALSRRGAQELDVAPGERVAIALAPGIDFAVALHACLAAGAIAVPVDLREPRERWLLEGAAAIIDRPLACAGQPLAARTLELGDVALIVRTSGTASGTPKEVPLTLGNFLWSALGSAVALGHDPEERWLCTLPLVHVGGLSILMRAWITGTTAVIYERFEAGTALEALMDGGITAVSVVPTTLQRLLDAGLERRSPGRAELPHRRSSARGLRSRPTAKSSSRAPPSLRQSAACSRPATSESSTTTATCA